MIYEKNGCWAISSWKLNVPVPIKVVLWKLPKLFFTKRSIHNGLERLLKETGSFTLLPESYISYSTCISINFLPVESLFRDYVNTNMSRNCGNRFDTTHFIDVINLLFVVTKILFAVGDDGEIPCISCHQSSFNKPKCFYR